jgi:flagellar biosynthesis protein FliR
MTLGLPVSTMIAFLYVMARVSGVIMFLPVPGFRNAPQTIRALLALALTLSLFPVWPQVPDELPSFGALTASAFAEAGFGLMAGLAVAFLNEGFQVAAQVFGLQAGYGFASTFDPTSQADSGVIQVLMSLITGLLFFALGLDREVVRVLAASFQKFPAGTWAPAAASLDGIVRMGGGIFTLGLRLAIPIIGLLLLLDFALALLGRMQQQLQLLSLAFPVKMIAATAILIGLSPVIAKLYEGAAERMVGELWRVVNP